nr:MAG TPA: hypothetical protein [Bacteriophage sp.]
MRYIHIYLPVLVRLFLSFRSVLVIYLHIVFLIGKVSW